MKKLFLLFFALLGVVLTSCGSDDDEVSAISNVQVMKTSCVRTTHSINITVGVKNYNPECMECWLHVGSEVDNMDFSQLFTQYKMNYDSSKKELSTAISPDEIKDKTNTLFGHLIITDFVKHESIELGEPIIVYTPAIPGLGY